jgi:hypothetical protein
MPDNGESGRCTVVTLYAELQGIRDSLLVLDLILQGVIIAEIELKQES